MRAPGAVGRPSESWHRRPLDPHVDARVKVNIPVAAVKNPFPDVLRPKRLNGQEEAADQIAEAAGFGRAKDRGKGESRHRRAPCGGPTKESASIETTAHQN